MMSKCVLCGIDTYWHTQLEEENARLQTELTALTAANDSNYNLLLAAQEESARLQAERDDAIVQHQECQEILIDCRKELDAAKKELEDLYSNKDFEMFSKEDLEFGVAMALMEPKTLLEPFAKLWDVIDKAAYFRQVATLAYDKETGEVSTKDDKAFWLSSKPFQRARKYLDNQEPNTAKAAAMQAVVDDAKELVEVEASFKTPMPLLIEKHKKLADSVEAYRAATSKPLIRCLNCQSNGTMCQDCLERFNSAASEGEG